MTSLGPLAGVRVVALEQAVAAPLCSRHLADLGAEVLKVERVGAGDFARHYDSVVHGESAHFAWLNRGKRSVALDIKAPADRALLDSMLAASDVFVHNLGPGAVDRLGLGWADLHARWPRLVSCAISGYGVDGPYRDHKAYDLLLQGECAVPSITGTPDEGVKAGISIADICAGMYALSAILAALHQRHATGEGTFIDVSMLETLTEWMTPALYYQLYGGAPPPRLGMRHNMIVPYGPYRVGDGSAVNLAVQNEGQWERLCRVVLRRPELASDPRFARNELRVRHRAELEPLIEALLADDTRPTAIQRLVEADVPFGALNDLQDLVDHPQLAARGRWLEAQSPTGPVRTLADPFNLLGRAPVAGAIPALGEHTEEVRARFSGRRESEAGAAR